MIRVFVPDAVPKNKGKDKNIFRVSVPRDKQGQDPFLSVSLTEGQSEGQKHDSCICPRDRQKHPLKGICVPVPAGPSRMGERRALALARRRPLSKP